jgi:outer membrane PBP1 activator LpoA protein
MTVCRHDRSRRLPGKLCALLLAPLLLWLSALSVAQTPAASEPRPYAQQPMVPMPGLGIPGPQAPSAGAPATPAAPAAAPVAPVPRNGLPIALVLPLDSPLYGRAAEAVRAGFAAAAAAAGARFDVYAHDDGGVVDAFARATAAGARVIVGPLVRNDLKALAASGIALPWTIALNQLDESGTLPPHVYTLALAVESEAVQLARRAQADGAHGVVIVSDDTPLQQRFAGAFTGEWLLLGGAAPVTFRVDRAPEMLALLRKEVAKAAPDAVLLALGPQDAALVRPYLGQVLAYAGSQINDHQPPESLRDLDDVRFVEMPWLADPANPEFAKIARPDYANALLDRLYALGVDAFRVAQAFVDGAPARLAFDGATGHLTLDASQQFLREESVMQFRDGEIVPAPAAR